MKRYMALDVGSVRIGIAVSDPLAITAQGIAVIPFRDWERALSELVEKYLPSTFVVGLPLRTSGERGPEVERVEIFSHRLKEIFPEIEIVFQDERFSSKIANQFLDESGISSRKRRGSVDSIAAAVFLQDFLDNSRRKDS